MRMRGIVARSGILLALIVSMPSIASATTQTYNTTDANQSFVVPSGVTSIHIQLWGAGGGTGSVVSGYQGIGGSGGYTVGDLSVTPGETLTIIVGRGGGANGVATYGGGGSGSPNPAWQPGGSGGGRSAVRRSSTELMTAGGGGGGGGVCTNTAGQPFNANGGAGGGTSGATGACIYNQAGGGAGTGSSGGSAGGVNGAGSPGAQFQGGNSYSQSVTGGGGGGWFGGGGGGLSNYVAGQGSGTGNGGGGSGYCGGSGVSGCTTTQGAGSAGGNNGQVIITYDACPIAAPSPWTNGHLISSGGTYRINTQGYNFCIANSSGYNYYVPVKTAAELAAFVNRIPYLTGLTTF